MFKRLLPLLFLASFASWSAESVEQTATSFYKWYIAQAADMKNPLASSELKKYTTARTHKALMRAYEANEIDADYFIKAQDFDDKDWLSNIKVQQVIVDPVCTNVYMSFGAANPKRVVDCFVKETSGWKIKAVTDLSPPQQ